MCSFEQHEDGSSKLCISKPSRGRPSMKKVKRAGGKGSLSASSIETRTTGKLHRVGEQIAASIVTPTNDTLLLNVTVRRTLRMALM